MTSGELDIAVGQTLFREGDPSDLAYEILSGRIEINKQTENGRITLARLRRGDILGEIGVLTGAARTATARALEHSRLRPLSRDDLVTMLSSPSGESLPLVVKLVDKIRSASNLVTDEEAREQLFRPAQQPKGLIARIAARFERRTRARQKILDYLPEIVGLQERPAPFAASAILIALSLLLVTGAVWASVVSVDRVVTAPGKIASTGRHILVQPIELGVIRSIDVAAGQIVDKGDVLATLDSTFALADLTANEALLTSLNAEIRRLEAEVDGGAPQRFSADPENDALQRALFEERRSNRAAQRRALEAEMMEVQAQQAQNEAARDSIEKQIEVVRELAGMRRELLSRQAGSRAQYLDTLREQLQLEHELTRLTYAAPELEQREAALDARLQALDSGILAEAASALQEAVRRRDSVLEDLRKAERRQGLIQLTAPADAVILEVAKLSVGSVIREAEPLFTLLPLNVPLEVQLEVNPRDIGRIRVDDPVRVKLDALPFQHHGTLEGKVRVISEDSFEINTPQGKATAYRVSVDLTRTDLEDVPPDFRLIPGMTVNGEIKIGDRRLISYFIYPIIRAIDESFREP